MTDRDRLLRELASCLDEALRLQSQVTDLSEQVYQAAGMAAADRAFRGRVTGLFYGLLAYLEELNRLVKEET